MNTRYSEQLFDTSKQDEDDDERILFVDLVAAQEYVLLCCQSTQTGGFTDRPKADGRYEVLAFHFFPSLFERLSH